MSGHTPGPWECGARAIIAKDQKIVLFCRPDCQMTVADARLIAAAPDLLEALKAAMERIPNEHDFDHTPSDDAVREQARTAIAKAEGKS